MKVSIVVAVDEKRGIGKAGKLPWDIPEDLKHFKEITLGHTIIMGRKTFESIGRVLPNRKNIIITRDPSFTVQGATIVRSLEEALHYVQGKPQIEEVFIIGGGQVFKEALEKNLVDKIYLTVVEARLDSPPESSARRGDFHCDTFFPDYSDFKKVSESQSYDFNFIKFKFVELKK